MTWNNYHSHTNFCDGTDSPETYVKAAIAKGMKVYGFSSHAPIPFFDCKWAMNLENLEEYTQDVTRLKRKYEDYIEILLGLEVDYIPDLMGPTAHFLQTAGLDYSIGSVHFVDSIGVGKGWEIDGPLDIFKKGLHEIFGGDIEKAVTRYFELTRMMLIEDCPDIVGHLDKIKMQNSREHFFNEDAKWYRDELRTTLEAIADSGAILEVNTRGIYKKKSKELYPGTWAIGQALELDIPIMLNSDGHHPNEIVGEFETAAEILNTVGYKSCMILAEGEWQEVGLSPAGMDY
jgi:histidinol-phosphatase (PHP family)